MSGAGWLRTLSRPTFLVRLLSWAMRWRLLPFMPLLDETGDRSSSPVAMEGKSWKSGILCKMSSTLGRSAMTLEDIWSVSNDTRVESDESGLRVLCYY